VFKLLGNETAFSSQCSLRTLLTITLNVEEIEQWCLTFVLADFYNYVWQDE